MRLPAKAIAAAKLAAVSVVALATLGQAANLAHPSTSQTPDGELAAGKPGFKIAGHMTGLYPGRSTKLKLTLSNQNAFAIVVRSVKASVRSVDAGCPATSIKVGRFKGKKRIAGRRSAKLSLAVLMKVTAPTACQGEKFSLIYLGKAVRA